MNKLTNIAIIMKEGVIFRISRTIPHEDYIGIPIIVVIEGMTDKKLPAGILAHTDRSTTAIKSLETGQLLVISNEKVFGWIPFHIFVVDANNSDLQLHPEKYLDPSRQESPRIIH